MWLQMLGMLDSVRDASWENSMLPCRHVNTPSKAEGFSPDNDGLEKTLTGAEIVLIPAGVPRKPGMTRDDLFNVCVLCPLADKRTKHFQQTNASIVRDLAKAAAQYCPKAHMLIIANPVNSTVPIVAEQFKAAGVFDEKRLFGVTTLDVVRASAFVSGIANVDPATVKVQVAGGHSGVTIVPLLSQTEAGAPIVKEGGQVYADLVKRIQFGGDEVVKAKDGAGSATLSMAYGQLYFTWSIKAELILIPSSCCCLCRLTSPRSSGREGHCCESQTSS